MDPPPTKNQSIIYAKGSCIMLSFEAKTEVKKAMAKGGIIAISINYSIQKAMIKRIELRLQLNHVTFEKNSLDLPISHLSTRQFFCLVWISALFFSSSSIKRQRFCPQTYQFPHFLFSPQLLIMCCCLGWELMMMDVSQIAFISTFLIHTSS